MIHNSMLAFSFDDFWNWKPLGNEMWRWLVLLGVLLVSLVVGKALSFVLNIQSQRLARRKGESLSSICLKSLVGPVKLLALACGLYIAGNFMTFPAAPDKAQFDVGAFWSQVINTIAVIAIGWAIFRLVDAIEHVLQKWASKTRTQLDDQLVPLIRKSLRIFVVIVVVLFIAQNIYGWSISTLIAGLGLGGLAFALAAKDALSNIFGSITIFADRPFQMGDRVKIGEHEGIVEEVGFRSTRIRTFFGHLVAIPNATVANASIDNVGRRPYIRRNLNITVTYDTTPEKLQEGIDIVKDMLEARKNAWPEDKPPKVYFSDFNATSLNILIIYWFTPPDYWLSLEFNHDFNMELLRRFNGAGIEFAFPTQTLYLKQDSPIAAELELKDRVP